MKKLEKIGKSVLALSILANTFMPLSMVGADPEPTTYDIVVELEEHAKKFYGIHDDSGDNETGTKISYSVIGADPAITGDLLLKKESVENSGNFDTVVTDATTKCVSQDKCTYSVPIGTKVKFSFETKEIDVQKATGDNRDPYAKFENHESISGAITVGVMEPTEYDGNPTLVWSCGNDVCYHQFTGLTGTEFISASTIKDDRDASKVFDVKAKSKGFVPTVRFAANKSAIDDGTLKIDKIIGPDGIDYPPVGEPQENNAYVSYGDRAFKAIIYNDEYKGLALGSLSELTYYPHEWANAFERRENYDISGTTKANPTEIDSVLLQNSFEIKKLNYNGLTISKIEALDVPEGAVEVTDGLSADSYLLTFNSNYFNKVTFKVTDSDNHEYFFMVNRRTTDPYIDVNPNNGKAKVITEVFYDRETNYDDYNVIATIQYKDGSKKVVRQEAINYGDAKIFGFIDDKVLDDQNPPDPNIPNEDKGKGIKRTKYAYETTSDELKKVDKIYINIEKKGSTEEVYAGNFAGSGKGDVIDMKYWEDRLV